MNIKGLTFIMLIIKTGSVQTTQDNALRIFLSTFI